MKFNSTGFLLLVSLTALNDNLDSFLQFHVTFRAHCRAQNIFENLNTILKVLEKITMGRNEISKLECRLLNNYLARFKYYYYRFFQINLLTTEKQDKEIILLPKTLNSIAIQNLFFLRH